MLWMLRNILGTGAFLKRTGWVLIAWERAKFLVKISQLPFLSPCRVSSGKFWNCFDHWKRKKKVLCDNWRPDQPSRQVDKPTGHNSFLPVLVKVALRQVTSAVLVADCNLHKSSAQSMWNTCLSYNYELSMWNTCYPVICTSCHLWRFHPSRHNNDWTPNVKGLESTTTSDITSMKCAINQNNK